MTPKEMFAARMNGREIGHEISEAECADAKEAGLVVVFSASDDLLEFRGAINDERGAYNGALAFIDEDGLIPLRDEIESDEVMKSYFDRWPKRVEISAKWDFDGYSFLIDSKAPYAAFEIVESDVPIEECKYCRGIVIDLKDLGR